MGGAYVRWAPAAIFALACFVAIEEAICGGWFWDADMAYIVSLGRSIVEGGIPTSDPLTVHTGMRCVAQQWGISVFCALVYDAGGKDVLVWAFVGLWGIAAVVVAASARYAAGNRPGFALAVSAACVIAMCPFMKTNPRVVDVLALCASMCAVEAYVRSGRARWLAPLPLLGAILANVHMTMWPVAAMGAVCACADVRCDAKKRLSLLLATFAVCASALVNPYGLEGATYVFASMAADLGSAGIGELSPTVGYAAYPFGFAVFFAALAYVALRVHEGDCRLYGEDVLFFGLWVWTLCSMRIGVLFFPAAAFALSKHPLEHAALRSDKADMLRVGLCATLAVCALGLTLSPVQTGTSPERDEAISSLKAAGLTPGDRVGNYFNTGGWLELEGFMPYVDERAELMFASVNGGEDIWGEMKSVMREEVPLSEWLAKWDFDGVLLERGYVSWHTVSELESCGYEVCHDGEHFLAAAKTR